MKNGLFSTRSSLRMYVLRVLCGLFLLGGWLSSCQCEPIISAIPSMSFCRSQEDCLADQRCLDARCHSTSEPRDETVVAERSGLDGEGKLKPENGAREEKGEPSGEPALESGVEKSTEPGVEPHSERDAGERQAEVMAPDKKVEQAPSEVSEKHLEGRTEIPVDSDCGNGTCEPSKGENCATCPSDCGCSPGQICFQEQCGCKNECTVGEKTCKDTRISRLCQSDANSCRYWTQVACKAGESCNKGICCLSVCASQKKECGDDGCGGSCGSCQFGCVSGLCKRSLLIANLLLPCGVCDDGGLIGPKADPFIKLTLSNGKSYQSKTVQDTCGKSISYSWTVGPFEVPLLKGAKIEVFDESFLQKDRLCVSWTGDFSKPGAMSLVEPNKKNATLLLYGLK